MRALKAFGKYFWRFMVIFSFIVNIVLVLVIVVLALTIFDIKKNIAQPLIEGLHSSFVGLNDSTIDWTIPVREVISVQNAPTQLDATIPISLAETNVVLTQPVPINVFANINLPGVGNLNNAQVALTLPEGLVLPVSLAFDLPVQQQVTVSLDVPVNLDVRAVIPLSQTQLHDPVDNLRLLFEPIVRILGNLPDDFSGVGPFAGQLLSNNPPNLLAETPYSQNPWPGYSTTAGLYYENFANLPIPPRNVPLLTGIVPTGGIPLLDQGLRPGIWMQGGPAAVNAQAAADAQAQGVPTQNYDGTYADTVNSPAKVAAGEAVLPIDATPVVPPPDTQPPPVDGAAVTPMPPDDLGIVPTPTPTG